MSREKHFPINSLVVFANPGSEPAKRFIEQHKDPGPYGVFAREGFAPGHEKHAAQPQRVTISVADGTTHEMPGSLFCPYC